MAVDSLPVVVIGGGLAGLAAAARLAKSGHPVELYERAAALGGRWRPYAMATEAGEVTVDDAPAVLTFPAPWRDLFRKSGRPLEAELTRLGWSLVPAGPAVYRFADGAELRLPSDRGEQFVVLRDRYGSGVAERWRDLLDALDNVWQALRPLGLEFELRGRKQLPRPIRQRLLAGRTIVDLATGIGHPHLAAILRSVAFRAGANPEQTPAMIAVALAVERTFGRWQLEPAAAAPDALRGRSSVLVEALAARLQLRGVTVHLDSGVTAIEESRGRVTGIRTAGTSRPAAAVVCTTDPWQVLHLLPPRAARAIRRRIKASTPARGPAISHLVRSGSTSEVTETIELDVDGVPRIRYDRPLGACTVETTHDYRGGAPDPGLGAAWAGFGSWLRRPPVTTELTGLFLAGPGSPGGASPSATVLSGALASYSCHDLLAVG
jgi:UDP-galactopyranose mutase